MKGFERQEGSYRTPNHEMSYLNRSLKNPKGKRKLTALAVDQLGNDRNPARLKRARMKLATLITYLLKKTNVNGLHRYDQSFGIDSVCQSAIIMIIFRRV